MANAGRQHFHVNHFNSDDDFARDGLRPYALYRDLGTDVATEGRIKMHVTRMVPPCTDEVRTRHFHDVEFQLLYILKGWLKFEFEGQGEVVLKAGSHCVMPAKIKHTVLDFSDDAEVLEILSPAEFDTVNVAPVK